MTVVDRTHCLFPSHGCLLLILWMFSGGSLCIAAETISSAVVAPVDERFATADSDEVPDFQQHVVPLLGRLGCNGRNCHGSFQGRGDFRLSLFGYDFQMDYAALTGESSSSKAARLDRQQPQASLILQKPLLQVDHEGGARFNLGSWEHQLLQRWIEKGGAGVLEPRELSHLEIEPAEVVFGAELQTAQMRVIAVWRDERREDVTPLCRYRSNDDAVVRVDQDGRLTSVGAGDTHVVAFYDNGVLAVPVLRPWPTAGQVHPPQLAEPPPPPVGIDAFVNDKLRKLAILPSELCTDSEFLRRVSLDLNGTLPTPQEIEQFLIDETADKRLRKIDELLQRPAYAAWWANKLCDFTGCNPSQQAELGQETSVQWYMWIYARLRENTPYDQLVRRIVLATGREPGQTYDEYAAEVSAYFRDDAPADFSQRATLPHYWTRRSMQQPEEAAQAFAHNFLGIRLQCAQCHKHPFAPWTQDDFKEFGHFFDNLKFGVQPETLERYREMAKQVGLNVRDDSGSAIQNEVLYQARHGHTVPWRELYIQPRSTPESHSLLRSGRIELQPNDDPRLAIMQWMSDPQNPWFARALVNRVWASYFHVGIIDPPDDLNPANPPSNPELLAWLTRDFVAHDYDLQWLHRRIVSSDAYQRSWKPNATNRGDRHNFSRAIPRRMPAEVVYDSLKQALAASDQLEEVRTDLTRRAIGHLSMRLAGTYAMQVFGKPDRAVNCDCERVNQPTLLQSVFLQNDPLVDQRLEESGWLQEVAEKASGVNLERLVHQAWLRTLSRPPSVDESVRAVEHVRAAESAVEGLRDLLWVLINTKEFVLVN